MAEKFQTIEIPITLVDKLRSHMNKHYMELFMGVNKQDIEVREKIVKILPFQMGEAIKIAMDLRLKNGKNILNVGEQIQLYSIMHREILGLNCSQEYIYQQKQKILYDGLSRPQMNSQNNQLIQAQNNHLKRQLFARKLASMITLDQQQSENQKEVDVLSRDLMNIFDREANDQKKIMGHSMLRNMKNNTSMAKPPLFKKQLQVEIQETEQDMINYKTILSASSSEFRQNKSTFNIYQCSPMFQKAQNLLLQDSPVNKSHHIKHVVRDHSERQVGLSKLLFTRYVTEKRKQNTQPRKVAMKGMSILQRAHQQGGLFKVQKENQNLNANSTIDRDSVAMRSTSAASPYLRTKESIDDVSKSVNNLDKERGRFFVIQEELNSDGTFKKTSKIRITLKKSQAFSNKKPPTLLTNQLLNSSRGKSAQHSIDFFNPKLNLLIYDEKEKEKLVHDQDLLKLNEKGYREKGKQIIQELENISHPVLARMNKSLKSRLVEEFKLDQADKEDQKIVNDLKGKKLYLHEKRDESYQKDKKQRIIKLKKIMKNLQ
ncbi:UNKNOWN [Stylonychia lemnae]|uniref:Uncharacterized protein n=1 Tax=Stylonychia lemnae TaxID=5949 RepID=A0A078ATB5_STYLE|nr:UNKNOWN [Stylonychia lemnae]|eukprot:CDW84113.1 UNKNOWN [Stylonychia lemnae]